MLTALLAVIGAWLLVTGGMWAAQERLIFMPDRRPAEASPPFAPERVRTADGLELRFLLAPPRGRPLVLYFHGNGGNAAHRAPLLRPLAEAGFGVAVAGYRGFGGNPGAPSEAGLVRDAQAHLAHLRARFPDAPLVLWGESLGTALATRLAAEGGAAAVVLDSPFTSVGDLAAGAYPWLPVRLLLRHAFESERHLAGLRVPLLILHAERDAVVPVTHAQRMLAAAEAAGVPAEAVFLPGSAHPAIAAGPDGPWLPAALAFLRRVGG
ncbi:alpha/beta hydrolase [Crenalkalicoccus roseus]|uniref:alpha/beta hydrolase n=1 Tax=Crenalkalicoccus roseus TaxID=1485588 RepID=UPI00108106EC|nr:alpha/beta fold hydrolase [Crenalkalicoccus roseus]